MEDQLYVTVFFKFKPEGVESAIPILKELSEKSRAEPGCLQYDIYPVLDTPGEFILRETYKSKEAFGEHKASEHYATLPKQLGPHLDSPPQVKVHQKTL